MKYALNTANIDCNEVNIEYDDGKKVQLLINSHGISVCVHAPGQRPCFLNLLTDSDSVNLRKKNSRNYDKQHPVDTSIFDCAVARTVHDAKDDLLLHPERRAFLSVGAIEDSNDATEKVDSKTYPFLINRDGELIQGCVVLSLQNDDLKVAYTAINASGVQSNSEYMLITESKLSKGLIFHIKAPYVLDRAGFKLVSADRHFPNGMFEYDIYNNDIVCPFLIDNHVLTCLEEYHFDFRKVLPCKAARPSSLGAFRFNLLAPNRHNSPTQTIDDKVYELVESRKNYSSLIERFGNKVSNHVSLNDNASLQKANGKLLLVTSSGTTEIKDHPLYHSIFDCLLNLKNNKLERSQLERIHGGFSHGYWHLDDSSFQIKRDENGFDILYKGNFVTRSSSPFLKLTFNCAENLCEQRRMAQDALVTENDGQDLMEPYPGLGY